MSNFDPKENNFDFDNSVLKSTINTCNNLDGLFRYKNACEGAVNSWSNPKNKSSTSELNLEFFKKALAFTENKIKKLTK